MQGVRIGRQGFLFDSLNKSKFQMDVSSFMRFCSAHGLSGKQVG